AEVALVDDLPVVLAGDAIDLHRLALVHEIEQGRERVAEADAAAAAVADVEHPLHFVQARVLVVERRFAPGDGMAGGGFERTFPGAHRLVSSCLGPAGAGPSGLAAGTRPPAGRSDASPAACRSGRRRSRPRRPSV